MKKAAQFIVLLVVIALIAVGSCLLTRLIVPVVRHSDPPDDHVGIHKLLHISPEQEKAIEPLEHRYAERRLELTQAIQKANAELADAILADKSVSPRVTDAIGKIHAAQGELQMVTMQHVFEMKAVLPPEQADALLRLTAEALRQETGSSH